MNGVQPHPIQCLPQQCLSCIYCAHNLKLHFCQYYASIPARAHPDAQPLTIIWGGRPQPDGNNPSPPHHKDPSLTGNERVVGKRPRAGQQHVQTSAQTPQQLIHIHQRTLHDQADHGMV